jgi:hypothetical protein
MKRISIVGIALALLATEPIETAMGILPCYGKPIDYVCLAGGTVLNLQNHTCGTGEGTIHCQSMWITEDDVSCFAASDVLDGNSGKIPYDCWDSVYVTVQTCDSACQATDTYHQGPVVVLCQGGSIPDTGSQPCHIVMSPVRLQSFYCIAFL